MTVHGVRSVRLIAVGDELLEGRTLDTNGQAIQKALAAYGVSVEGAQVVRDDPAAISAALDRTQPGDLVFLTGGLGSTPDDLTREALADWAEVDLVLDTELEKYFQERRSQRGLKPLAKVQNQSLVPTGMTPLNNPVGSAPGLVGLLAGRLVVVLPGVPAEMTSILPAALDWLAGRDQLDGRRLSLLWRTAQVPEMHLVQRCREIRERHPGLSWSWWLTQWGVDLRVSGPQTPDVQEAMQGVEQGISAELGNLVFSRRLESLPQVVQHLLEERGNTLSVAESCTAGLLAASLTEQPGASVFFRGGMLVYSDQMKRELLGVSDEILDGHGAVSEATVLAMAQGCRMRLQTDFALAVSGIAGPDGGTAAKPVGTTFIALATPQAVFAGGYRFPADRWRNRLLTVATAVDSLRRVLETAPDQSPWNRPDVWRWPS